MTLFWDQLVYLEHQIKQSAAGQFSGVGKAEILQVLFGNPAFIYIRRRNKVKQAISFVKAYQSDTFIVAAKDHARRGAGRLYYDRRLIAYYYQKLTLEDLAWEAFFKKSGLTPDLLWYEDFVKDYKGSLEKIIEFLDLAPREIEDPLIRKQADAVNHVWYQRFLKDNPGIEDPETGNQLVPSKTLNELKYPPISRSTVLKFIHDPIYYTRKLFDLFRR